MIRQVAGGAGRETLRTVLKELRGPDGAPHAGTRLLALGLVLLLAAPLTYLLGRTAAWLLHLVIG